jgi:hypothetical protein
MAVAIELARAMEPLTFFGMKVFNAQLAIRYKSATQLNTHPYCEKTRCVFEQGAVAKKPGLAVRQAGMIGLFSFFQNVANAVLLAA